MITVIIPTCSMERFKLLTQTVKSIQAGTYKDVQIVIVVDGNRELFEKAYSELRDVIITRNKKRKDWIYSINRILKEVDSDFYIYASDDLFFPPNCIRNAVNTMHKRFSDGFGVIGLGRKGKAAFGLFGRKWADHFPDRQVFCPDFIHFRSDSEMYRVVTELERFATPRDRENQVKHFREKDETWRWARRIRTRDRAIGDKRREKGYKWGIDFNRVTG